MSDGIKASAVVVNYMRPDNIPLILDSLQKLDWVDEIIVWDNSPPLKTEHSPDEGIVGLWPKRDWKHSKVGLMDEHPRNEMLYGRFRAAMEAKNDWIITQDDDYIVRNWERIRASAISHPEQITACMFYEPPQYKKQMIPCGEGCWDIMLGWGSMFRKELIAPVMERYIRRWGIDDVLLRDADRVFTTSQRREHNMLEQDVQALPGVTGDMSMHLDRSHKCISKMARMRAVLMITGKLTR